MDMQVTKPEEHSVQALSMAEKAWLALSSLATFAILAWVWGYSRYGFDFTDESFYLAWMASPFLYEWSTTQFGFVYHPLYLLLDGNIVGLRRFNILALFGLGWVLAYLILMGERSFTPSGERAPVLVLAAGFALAVLIYFDWWLPTPSYNSLTLQALMITMIGALLAEGKCSARGLLGGVLIGIGGWLTFMAKPSAAMMLALGTLLFLFVARKFSLRLLVVAIAAALIPLLASALWIDGSIAAFVARLRTGVQFYGHVDAGHSVIKSFRLDSFNLTSREKIGMLLAALLTILSANGLKRSSRVFRCLGWGIAGIGLLVALMLAIGLMDDLRGWGAFRNQLVWAIPLAAVVLVVQQKRLAVPSCTWGLVALCGVMPHIFAFGSNGNYWQMGGLAAFFWLLSGVALLSSVIHTQRGVVLLFPFVFATQAIAAVLLQTGFQQPYRQPQALKLNDVPSEVGAPGSVLVLSRGYAAYLEEAGSAARAAGLRPGTPVIDLTGQSPGILYAWRAMNIGQPWTVGGYPGSQKLAEAALGRVSCAPLSESWVLVEESGPRRITAKVLESYGANFEEHFEPVASWHTASGAGSYVEPREQKLYKPTRSATTLDNCLRLRSG